MHMALYRFAPFVFDVSTRILSLEDGSNGIESRELRFKTAQLLQCFLERPDHLWSKSELLEKVWNDVFVGEAVVFQTLSELRKELASGSSEPMIETVKGKGYRWVGAEPQEVDPLAAPAEDGEADGATGHEATGHEAIGHEVIEPAATGPGTAEPANEVPSKPFSSILRTATRQTGARRTALLTSFLVLVVLAVAGLASGTWMWSTDAKAPSLFEQESVGQ